MGNFRFGFKLRAGTYTDGSEWEEYFVLLPKMNFQIRQFIAFLICLGIAYFGFMFISAL